MTQNKQGAPGNGTPHQSAQNGHINQPQYSTDAVRLASIEELAHMAQIDGGTSKSLQRQRLEEFLSTLEPHMRELLEGQIERAILRGFKADPKSVVNLLPNQALQFPSLAELAKDLPPTEWYWPGWIARGMLSILAAMPGIGKSMVALEIARRQIHETTWPDGSPIQNPGAPVLYVDAENVPQIINQRAEWWQIDRKKLFLMLPDADDILDLGKSKYQDKLYKMVAVINPGVIIIDSLSTISTKGESAVEDVRNILAFLSGIARGFNVPVLLIHHIKKRSLPGMKSVFVELDLEDLRGSSHIVAIGRTIIGIWQVQTTPDADDGPRKMAVLKSNLGAKPKALGFEMKPLHPAGVTIQWLDSPPEAYRSPTRIDECAEWLLGYLAEMGEPVKPNDVLRAATLQGFSRSTVYRARNALKDAITDTGPSPHAPNNAWKISDVEK